MSQARPSPLAKDQCMNQLRTSPLARQNPIAEKVVGPIAPDYGADLTTHTHSVTDYFGYVEVNT